MCMSEPFSGALSAFCVLGDVLLPRASSNFFSGALSAYCVLGDLLLPCASSNFFSQQMN